MNTVAQPSGIMEVCRSFSFRVNVGNYEHEDHFCSAKRECLEEEAEEMSERLYKFCRSRVLKSINEEFDDPLPVKRIETATKPSIDKYAVGVVPEPVAEASFGTHIKEAVAIVKDWTGEHKEVSEPERLRAIVMGSVPGCTKKHLAQFYMGWFGVDDSKALPKDQALYIEPLTALMVAVDKTKESHELLVSNPKKLGVDTKDENNKIVEVVIDGVAPPEPPPSTDPPKTGEWKEFMDLDPLMEKFRWHSFETLAYAKALMAKFKKDHAGFADYLRFLKMDTLSEPDLLCLFKLLFHAPDGNALWKKAEQKNMPLRDAFAAVEKNLGCEITMQNKSHDVLTAITITIAEM